MFLKRDRGFLGGFIFNKQKDRGKGKPFSESYLRKAWNEACKKEKVQNITLYEGTRHSLASQAINKGVPISTIQKFLRHESPKMTERYAHLNTESLRIVQRSTLIIIKDEKKYY